MSEPEYLVCTVCDTPVYEFEWRDDKVISVLCLTCGADDPKEFVTEAEYEEQQG